MNEFIRLLRSKTCTENLYVEMTRTTTGIVVNTSDCCYSVGRRRRSAVCLALFYRCGNCWHFSAIDDALVLMACCTARRQGTLA